MGYGAGLRVNGAGSGLDGTGSQTGSEPAPFGGTFGEVAGVDQDSRLRIRIPAAGRITRKRAKNALYVFTLSGQ